MGNVTLCSLCNNIVNSTEDQCHHFCVNEANYDKAKLEKARTRLRKSFDNILEEKGDPETDHLAADKALIQFIRDMGLDDVAEQFENLSKWYA